jgi:glycosyltransferase involved in cell wall biosynthesis
MHIAYVTVHVAPEIMQGGVGKKIRNQTAIWREQGHEAVIFCLTPAEISIPEARQFIFDSKSGLLQREIARSATLKKMLAAIRKYQPDLIYLRFGLYSYPLHQLFKIAPVVLETNSDDRPEYRQRGLFFHWLNLLTRNLTIGPASGIIIPSHELENVIVPKHDKPACVISNGIDIKDIEPLPPTKNTNPVITLVGSPGMDWHGVDKLIKFAETSPNITINIVGYSQTDVKSPIPANVHLHGFLSREEVREVMLSTDVSCGTLALHRKNMDEASPLKVRESLAYGIPVIIAYHDTDLHGIQMETILHIPNSEDNVIGNAKRIRQFAHDMLGKRVDGNSLMPLLDQRHKEKKRLDFFESFLQPRP